MLILIHQYYNLLLLRNSEGPSPFVSSVDRRKANPDLPPKKDRCSDQPSFSAPLEKLGIANILMFFHGISGVNTVNIHLKSAKKTAQGSDVDVNIITSRMYFLCVSVS